MNPSTTPHSYFTLPVWPRSSFRKKRRPSDSPPPSATSSQSSRASSPSSDPDLAPPSARVWNAHTRNSRILAAQNLLPLPSASRRNHISVITTILHKCVLTGDWTRAQRAFGILLQQKDVELRQFWGLGVDILLRVNRKGDYEQAIEFVDRLVLFYPFRARWHSQHPALKGGRELRQREERARGEKERENAVDGGKKRRRRRRREKAQIEDTEAVEEKKVQQGQHISAVDFMPALYSLLVEGSRYVDVEDAPKGVREGLAETRPEKIKERLEQVMLTPPWSDMDHLMLVRGMVCLWIADLERERTGRAEEPEEGQEVEMDAEMNERVRRVELERGRQKITGMKTEAKVWFTKIRELGGTLPEPIEDWLVNGGDDEYMDLDDTTERNDWEDSD